MVLGRPAPLIRLWLRGVDSIGMRRTMRLVHSAVLAILTSLSALSSCNLLLIMS
jgi:hypothetical protein